MDSVQRHYADYIKNGGDGDGVLHDRGRALGYDDAFLQPHGLEDSLPLFSGFCGSGCPLRLPGGPLKGETVIDLGCGAGHDLIIASAIVGSSGKVIGIDYTKEMLTASRANINRYQDTSKNIALHQALIDAPNTICQDLGEGVADVVISNGVFNLCADKRAAFETAFRLLKPGGRFLLSDLCKVKCNPNAVVSCSVGDGWSS